MVAYLFIGSNYEAQVSDGNVLFSLDVFNHRVLCFSDSHLAQHVKEGETFPLPNSGLTQLILEQSNLQEKPCCLIMLLIMHHDN